PHSGAQQLGQRLAAERVQQRLPDPAVHVADAGQRVRRVDDSGAEREAFEPEPLSLVHQDGGRPLVHLQHESRSAHPSAPSRSGGAAPAPPGGPAPPFGGAKAILTLPERPADSACDSASRQRVRGYTPSTKPPRASWEARSSAAWKSSAPRLA